MAQEQPAEEALEGLSEFSLRNQKKAAAIIRVVRSTPSISVDSKTLSMLVDGKKTGIGNLLDFTYAVLEPMDKSPISEGM